MFCALTRWMQQSLTPLSALRDATWDVLTVALFEVHLSLANQVISHEYALVSHQ